MFRFLCGHIFVASLSRTTSFLIGSAATRSPLPDDNFSLQDGEQQFLYSQDSFCPNLSRTPLLDKRGKTCGSNHLPLRLTHMIVCTPNWLYLCL